MNEVAPKPLATGDVAVPSAAASAAPVAAAIKARAPLGALARLRILIVAATVFAVLLFVAVAWYAHQRAFAEARQRLDTTVGIAKEHAQRLLDTNQMLMQRMLDLLGAESDAALLARGAELHERLRAMADGLPQIQGLFVSGADARMIASSRVYPPLRDIDYSDREMFKVHRAERDRVFVTDRLVSRATGEPFFDVSRRRDLADGTFGGVVSTSLRPEYVEGFYEDLATGVAGLRIALVRGDGSPLATWPASRIGARVPAESELGQRFAANDIEGRVDGLSPSDGAEHLRAFKRLDGYPLYVVASIDRERVQAEWLSELGLITLIALPIAAGFASVGWIALRRTQAGIEAMQQLGTELENRQRMELALQQSQKLEAIGRMTGAVAHEFNNVLMVVGSSAYLLQKTNPAMAGSPQLAAIERAVSAGTKVTRQLLAFSHRQPLLVQRIRLQDRLPALIDLLRPVLGGSIRLSSSVAPDTAAIEIDPSDLELAIINVAINAKDAMPGGGTLTIDARNADRTPPGFEAGRYVVIEVCDTGSGIAGALLPKVFDPFFTTKPAGHGTGLGLSQVKAMCQSAGADASIESLEGKGTRVMLYFREASGAAAAEASPRVGAALDRAYRVLVVEDNPEVRRAVRSLLASLRCSVFEAHDANAALEFLDTRRADVDVVLSDIEMPGGMDGIALAASVRERHPALPVVLMTGYAERIDHAVALEFEVLPKPCSAERMVEALNKVLARQPAMRGDA